MLESNLEKVPLHHLRDGSEYPMGNINMRKEGGDADLGPLCASLKENGQLQNMVGSRYGSDPEVYLIIGNRRRRAAQKNQDESPRLQLNNMDVRVYQDLTVAQAMEIGLAEKLTELPHHEVDQYEAFAALGDKDPAEIAAHFDCSERLVKQRMKLGALSEKIRKAWRAGQIDRKTAEAFTLAKDLKAQDKAFDALSRTHGLNAQTVRARLLPGQEDVPRFLRFASEEFAAAGGTVITDLFHDDHGVSDPALLKRVAEEKLAGICAAYVSEHGFAWAKPESEMPAEWHGWDHTAPSKVTMPKDLEVQARALEAILNADDASEADLRDARVSMLRIETMMALEGFSPKARKKVGVVAAINGDGGLDLVMGVVRPEPGNGRVLPGGGDDTPIARIEPERAGGPAPEEKKPGLSFKSQAQRAVELTTATSNVLRDCPDLALIVLLAGFADRSGYGVIRATLGGGEANALKLMDSDDAADNLPRLKAMKGPALAKMAAAAAAATVLFQAHSAERAAIEDDATRALLSLLPKEKLAKALANVFDADDYFGGALPKDLALDAIRENCGQAVFEQQRDSGAKAADLRAFALANLKPDWLPPPLRFPGYAGPGAKKVAARAGKSASKKATSKSKKKAK